MTTRRLFLTRGVAVLGAGAAALALPRALLAEPLPGALPMPSSHPLPMPRLWGDGVHDDTAALQALIDAVPPVGGRLDLPRGTYRVTRELVLRDKRHAVLDGGAGAALVMDGPGATLRIEGGCEHVTIARFTFRTGPSRPAPAYMVRLERPPVSPFGWAA